jgi:DNA-binding NarL/FixJ family response regulator
MRRQRVLIADDHPLMLAALRLALQDIPDFEIVGAAQSGSEVLPLVGRTQPDLVLLDLRMPGMDGLACLEQLRTRHPEVKTIVLSGIDDANVVESAFRHGARAFITKQIDPRDLPSALRHAVEGTVSQMFGGGPRASDSVRKDLGLTERELAILQSVADGLSNKEIAKRFYLAEQTVKFHLTSIYRKLDVRTRTEAAREAYHRGILEPPLLERAGIS